MKLTAFAAFFLCSCFSYAWAVDCDLKSYHEALVAQEDGGADIAGAEPQDSDSETSLLSLFLLEKPREKLEEKGISFEAVYVGDMISNLAGGLRRKTTYLGNLDLSLTIDLDKTGLIPGGKLYVSGNDTHGGKPTAKYVGDLQGVDNIEAPAAMRLYEYWYEQSFWGDKVSVLAGVQGLDSEFAISEHGALYLNSSFGTPPDLSANAPMSMFPYAGLASRIKIKPHEQVEFLAGIYEGDPSDNGKNIHGVDYRISSSQGLMLIFEGAYHQRVRWNDTMEPLRGSVKFGSWIHTNDTDHLLVADDAGNPVRRRNNYGFYGLIDQMIFREKKSKPGSETSKLWTPTHVVEGEEQGLGIFLQFGGAPSDRNLVAYYFGAGLNYTGLIPKRDKDILGVAVANAFMSRKARKARGEEIDAFDPTDPDAGPQPGQLMANESTLEITYRIQLHERLALQPDYQVVFNPSGEKNIKTAHVFGLRFEVTY
jgi:porin